MTIIIADLNLNIRKMTLNNHPLTKNEFLIVLHFFYSPNEIIPYEDLAILLWGTNYYSKNTLRQLVSRTLKKLRYYNLLREENLSYKFHAVKDIGYIFETFRND